MFTYDMVSGWYLATKTTIQIDNISPSLETRCHKYNVQNQSGHALFSSLLPDDFYYRNDDVIIVEGILVQGILELNHLKDIYKQLEYQYGSSDSTNFIIHAHNIGESLHKLFLSYQEIKEPE